LERRRKRRRLNLGPGSYKSIADFRTKKNRAEVGREEEEEKPQPFNIQTNCTHQPIEVPYIFT